MKSKAKKKTDAELVEYARALIATTGHGHSWARLCEELVEALADKIEELEKCKKT